MKSTHIIILAALIGVTAFAAYHFTRARTIPEPGIQDTSIDPGSNERKVTFLSDVYEIKDIYRSMKGPSTKSAIRLLEGEEPELIWIRSYSALMVEPDGKTRMSQEFMCHSNLDSDAKTHNFLFQSRHNPPNDRLFTLSQGQQEIEFPEGFGIPVLTPETLTLSTQVLNLNHELPDIKTRHKVEIKYIRDSELKSPIKPLIRLGSNSLKRLDELESGYYNVESPDEELHGAGCLFDESAGKNVLRDRFNRRYTGHWVVKPGREVNSTLITDMLKTPYDTRIHYIAVHLHPFAESLELKDITTGETVFKSKARNSKNKIGLDHVDYYSSPEGIPIYKDHEYQLISTYNNTTDTDQDSMAVVYIYALDREYQKPDPSVAKILSVQPPSNMSGGEM